MIVAPEEEIGELISYLYTFAFFLFSVKLYDRQQITPRASIHTRQSIDGRIGPRNRSRYLSSSGCVIDDYPAASNRTVVDFNLVRKS